MKKINWTKIKDAFASAFGFILGLNFYGFGILIVGILLLVFVKGSISNMFGWSMVGVFIGKNAQAIKEHLDRMIKLGT